MFYGTNWRVYLKHIIPLAQIKFEKLMHIWKCA